MDLNFDVEFFKNGGIVVMDFNDYMSFEKYFIQKVNGVEYYVYVFITADKNIFMIYTDGDLYGNLMQVYMKDDISLWAKPFSSFIF
jgi:hypothetical protein